MGKIKAFVPRSRLGCVSCKRRRVKCDETHPKCNKCERLKLDCKYENVLRWEDDARQRGVTFGRSYEARQRRRQPYDHQLESRDESLEHDMTAFVDITAKRGTYLFVTSTYEDFSKIYDIGNKENLLKPKSLQNARVSETTMDTSENQEALIDSINKSPSHPPNHLGAISKSTSVKSASYEEFVDLDSLVLDASIIHNSSSGKLIPFYSNSIPKMFSSQEKGPNICGFNQESTWKIDDIFLQSFSSPHLSQLSSPLLNLEDAFAHQSLIPPLVLSHDPLGSQPVMNALEESLIAYFIESICPYCVCFPKAKKNHTNLLSREISKSMISPELNPYLYLIVPLALRSRLVMKALVATSAKQLVLLGQKQFEETAKKYSFEVLRELPQIIVRKQSEDETDWDDILATMVMLCFTEISASCSSSWLIHLNGAKQFLKNSCIQNNLSPIGRFFVRYFISHEVMAETAWVYDSSQHSMRPINDDPCIETLKNDDDTKIDLVLGCSPFLISLVHRISVLGKCFEDLEMEPPAGREGLEREILSQYDHLEHSLLSLSQQLPMMEEGDESALHIETIAEIKKLAALIYLFARIQLEFQFYHKTTANINSALKKAKGYIKKIMQLHETLPGCYVSLLWPIFIIGIVCTDEEERWFVIYSMTEMEKHRELSSVKSAKDVVLSVWSEKDLGGDIVRWKDMIKGKAETISLA